MKCQRCRGIMVPEEYYGVDDMFSGWRCIFCGEIVDPVILQNRRTQEDRATPSHPRRHRFEILSINDAPRSGMQEEGGAVTIGEMEPPEAVIKSSSNSNMFVTKPY